jgi:L-malate glycosyltransferase
MKILVLTHEFPPVGGGGGRVAQDIALGLARRGHELCVLTAHLDGLPPFETVAGVRVERLSRQRKAAFRADFAEMARYDWSALTAGLKIVREWQPDVIHAHFAVPAGAAAYALSKLTGVPYVLTAHLGDVPGAVPEKTDRWFKWIYPFTPAIWKNAAKVVAVSEFTRGLAQKHYHIPMEVIPNGVDLASLPPHQPSAGIPHIVFAGRFVETKNPGHLVAALTQLKDLSWTCAMLGDGPLLESVRETVSGCGLTERFSLPGWVTPEQVLSQFAQSDLLVLPSRSEGLSVVGVQALAMGLALVLSDAGGNLELVENGVNGFTFPVGDVAALTAALRQLLQNPTLLQSAQAKSRQMAKKFDLDTIIGQYDALLRSVCPKSLIPNS